jgi:hypothetical protein
MATLEDALDKLENAIGKLEAAQAAMDGAGESGGRNVDLEDLAKAAEEAQSENAGLRGERERIATRIDKVIGHLNAMLEDEA